MMHVETEDLNNLHSIDIKGGVTLEYASELKEVLLESLANYADIDVCLREVSEIDTAGIQTLWFGKREARRANKKLHYIELSPIVIELLQAYNLLNEFSDSPASLHGGG